MIRIQNTGVFIILLTIFETLVTDQDFNHPHQSHLYPGKCRNVRHSHLGKRQKDKKYLNRSRGSQARWELDGLPTQITLDRRLYNWSALIHTNMIHKSFFSHTNTIWVNIPLPASKSASDFGNYISIYPSQRQNLLPTLEIVTHNFQNFQKIQNFGKKIPKSRIFFPKFPKPQRGRLWH